MDALGQLKSSLAGRYAIDREIGRGGMATVYLARDVRHNRRVALKVLNPELGAVLGVERFLSEIQVTANLQHPNLLPLFDSGEAEGLLFYVMPYVDGESLRGRLQREKQLPIDEAIHLATAVASALDYAHRHGVIHRDLKPENILLHEGQPMVADFGIALAVSNAGGNRITQTGLSLGTPQYMSPEQATGDRHIDGRTDVYSLGAMLYEMLTGEPPHSGTTSQAIIAKVITDKPRSIRLTRDTVSPNVEWAVERALAKLPADRFHTAHEFADALHGKSIALPAGVATPASYTPPVAPSRESAATGRWRSLIPWGVAVVALGIAAAWVAALRGEARRASQSVRFALTVPPAQRIVLAGSFGTPVAISPDGRTIVFSGRAFFDRQLYARPVDQLAIKAIPGTERGSYPVFSPDGKWIAFLAGTELRVVPAEGGPPVTVAMASGARGPTGVSGFTWISNDEIVFANDRLNRVALSDRQPTLITQIDSAAGEGGQFFPVAVPGEDFVLYASQIRGSLLSGRIAVASLKSGKGTVLPVEGLAPLGLAGNRLIYVQNDGALMAVPFDRRRMLTTGSPYPIGEQAFTTAVGGATASLSPSGSLVYVDGTNTSTVELVSASGARKTLFADPRRYAHPRLSPDGKKLALEIGSAQGGDIWVFDIASATLTHVTTQGVNDRPEWTPDGRRLIFPSASRGSIFQLAWQPADGSGSAEQLHAAPNPIREATMSPDGRLIVYREDHPTRDRDIWVVPVTGDRKPEPLVVTEADELMPRISPDGRWLLYVSNESGQYEVYVRPFPGAGPRLQVSTGGGHEPLWARDGRRIFYRNGAQVIAATISGRTALAVASRQALFEGDFATDIFHPNYDVSLDGSQFVMLKPVDDNLRIVVVLNWLRDLDRRASAR